MYLKKTRNEKQGRGLAAVEAALLVPLILLILLAILEYGWMFLKAQEINNAARHGARVGIRESASNAEVTSAVSQIMTDAGLDASGYSVTLNPSDVSLINPGDPFTVTVTVPYTNIELTGAPVLPSPTNLKGETTMAKEGVQ